MKPTAKRRSIDQRAAFIKKYGLKAGLLILRYRGIIGARSKTIDRLKGKIAALTKGKSV